MEQKRLIDMDALLLRVDCHGTNKFGMLDEDIREFIRKQPTIDPENLRPVGKWLFTDEPDEWGCGYIACSRCGDEWGEEISELLKYCPNCGARMVIPNGQ